MVACTFRRAAGRAQDEALTPRLRFKVNEGSMENEKVIVIGSGPAGLTAAMYAARARLNPLVISGSQLGGQISITYEVENYPGFPEGIAGPELVELMQKQAERFGARLAVDEVTRVDLTQGSPFTVKTFGQEYQAEALVIATGASPNRLGIPGEESLIGRGVSFCATCDGFFFRDKDVVVVGGGDSAMEEGLFLTRFASRVRVIHRRNELRAGETLKRRAMENEKMSFIWQREGSGSSDAERQVPGDRGTRHRRRIHLHRPLSKHRSLQGPGRDGPERLSSCRRTGNDQRARCLCGWRGPRPALPPGRDLRRTGGDGRNDGRALAGGTRIVA
jgi:thioredoxin reductase